MPQAIDHAEIKTGQLLTMALAVGAYMLDNQYLILALAALFLVTALYRSASPFVLFYRLLVRPLHLMRSDYRLDNIQPHSFGQFIGALTALAAFILLFRGWSITGWGVVWVLILLTFISFRGWCIGCFLYYQLNRVGLGGFFRHKPTDNDQVLGARPRVK